MSKDLKMRCKLDFDIPNSCDLEMDKWYSDTFQLQQQHFNLLRSSWSVHIINISKNCATRRQGDIFTTSVVNVCMLCACGSIHIWKHFSFREMSSQWLLYEYAQKWMWTYKVKPFPEEPLQFKRRGHRGPSIGKHIWY